MLDYSVVIRTVGTAGEKYQRLLDSICKQTVKPKEILVVLPEGYALPPEQLGYERFVYSPKGMVIQRVVGALEAKGEYCLFLDDDLFFDETLVEKLSRPILEGRADVSFPVLKELLPQSFKVKFLAAITGAALPLFNEKKYVTKIISSGGYAYNPAVINLSEGEFWAQTAPGACYLVKRTDVLKMDLSEELWLEKTSYPLPEDQVMFYKFHKLGFRILGFVGLNFVHLNAGESASDRLQKASFAMSRNKLIFWHRFIYLPDRDVFSKAFSVICLMYWMATSVLLRILGSCFSQKQRVILKHSMAGFKSGFSFLFSDEYKKLHRIGNR